MKVTARLASIRQETPTVKSFRLELEDAGFRFLPGQWVDLYVEIAGRLEVAGYSITSSPLARGTIELAVKLVGGNPVTHYMHDEAKVGDLVLMEGGQGDFYYQREMADSLVLIAGGIGITPVMSIGRYVDEDAPDVTATLLYSAGAPTELLFRDRLEAISGRNKRIRCLFTVTRPGAEHWEGRVGRIDRQMLASAGLDPAALYYVCGPPTMVEDMLALLWLLGVPSSRVKFERWW